MGIVVLVFALLVFTGMAVLGLYLVYAPWPGLAEKFSEWSARMHRRPLIWLWVPAGLTVWGAVDGVWKAVTVSPFYGALAFMAGAALVITLRIWFWAFNRDVPGQS